MPQGAVARARAEKQTRQTGRVTFPAGIDKLVARRARRVLIERFVPQAGHRRPPVGREGMRRLPGLARWLHRSDARYGGGARRFDRHLSFLVCIDSGRNPAPDATAISQYPPPVGEERARPAAPFDRIDRRLAVRGLTMTGAILVDTTITAAAGPIRGEARRS